MDAVAGGGCLEPGWMLVGSRGPDAGLTRVRGVGQGRSWLAWSVASAVSAAVARSALLLPGLQWRGSAVG